MAALPDVLRAEALELRRCRRSHLAELMAAIEASQPELTRWLPWADPLPTEEAELEFLREHERSFDDDDYGYFLFARDSANSLAASGSTLKRRRPRRSATGFARTAAGAMTNAAFHFLAEVDRVIIRMDQANHASAAVPPKLGLTLQGEDLSRRVPSADRSGKGWIWACHRPPN